MESANLTLIFTTGTERELVESVFSHPRLSSVHRCVRGRTQGAFFGHGTFEWTRAVKALSLLVVKAKLSGIESCPPQIAGYAGSLAASLDYALDKQPNWMIEMFGCDVRGTSLLRSVIARSNTGRKRSGPVTLAIKPGLLSGDCIGITVGQKSLASPEELLTLSQVLEEGCESLPLTSCSAPSRKAVRRIPLAA